MKPDVTPTRHLAASCLAWESNQAIKVVMVYEDFATGLRAQHLFDNLRRQLKPECELNESLWKFEVLAIPRLSALAAEEAATADLVIISMRDDGELPAKIKDWLESWVSEQSIKESALVAMFDETRNEGGQTASARTSLRRIAQRGGRRFFADPPGLSEGDLEFAPSRITVGTESSPTLWASRFDYDPPARHWGINE